MRKTLSVEGTSLYVLLWTWMALRFTFYVLLWTWMALRFTFYVLLWTWMALRFTYHVSRITFYVLPFYVECSNEEDQTMHTSPAPAYRTLDQIEQLVRAFETCTVAPA